MFPVDGSFAVTVGHGGSEAGEVHSTGCVECEKPLGFVLPRAVSAGQCGLKFQRFTFPLRRILEECSGDQLVQLGLGTQTLEHLQYFWIVVVDEARSRFGVVVRDGQGVEVVCEGRQLPFGHH